MQLWWLQGRNPSEAGRHLGGALQTSAGHGATEWPLLACAGDTDS